MSPPPTLEVPEKREGAVPLVLVLVVLVTLEALCFGSYASSIMLAGEKRGKRKRKKGKGVKTTA